MVMACSRLQGLDGTTVSLLLKQFLSCLSTEEGWVYFHIFRMFIKQFALISVSFFQG